MDRDNPISGRWTIAVNGAVGRAVEDINRADQTLNGWITQVKPEILQYAVGNPEISDPKKGINFWV